MINVALLSVIRRWHLREQMSIREIARRTGLSRNTVRKYLKNGVVTPAYPKRKARSKLDAFSAQLTEWLEREWSRGRKQRRNVKELFLALRGIGYSGSYDRVCAFARQVATAQAGEAAGDETRHVCPADVRSRRSVSV